MRVDQQGIKPLDMTDMTTCGGEILTTNTDWQKGWQYTPVQQFPQTPHYWQSPSIDMAQELQLIRLALEKLVDKVNPRI